MYNHELLKSPKFLLNTCTRFRTRLAQPPLTSFIDKVTLYLSFYDNPHFKVIYIYCDCKYISNEKLKRHVPTDVLLSFAAGQLEGHVTVDGMLQVEDRAVLDHYDGWSGEPDNNHNTIYGYD